MRRILVGALSAGALFVAGPVSSAVAEPNEQACAHTGPHGTQVAHQTVPEDNHQAHMSIPHFCD